jgi:DNA-binding NarL/FixJ family response regulator
MLLLKIILKSLFPNVRLIESINGVKTVAKSVESELDLIVMDVQIPVLNRLENTKKLEKYVLIQKCLLLHDRQARPKKSRNCIYLQKWMILFQKPTSKEAISEAILKWTQPIYKLK